MSIEYQSNINGQIVSPGDSCCRNTAFVTLMAWYFPYDYQNLDNNDTPNKGFIFDALENVNYCTFRFGISRINDTTANLWAASRPRSGDAYQQIWGGSVLGVNQWYHLCAMFDFAAAKCYLYVNGASDNVPVALGGWGSPTINTDMTCECVGQVAVVPSAGNWLHGKIDDCRVYNVQLSPAQISTIYRVNGNDAIVNGLQHRFLMTSGAYDSDAAGVGVLKDMGERKVNFDNKFPAQDKPKWKESKINLTRGAY